MKILNFNYFHFFSILNKFKMATTMFLSNINIKIIFTMCLENIFSEKMPVNGKIVVNSVVKNNNNISFALIGQSRRVICLRNVIFLFLTAVKFKPKMKGSCLRLNLMFSGIYNYEITKFVICFV